MQSAEVLRFQNLVVEPLGQGHQVLEQHLELSVVRLAVAQALNVLLDFLNFVSRVLRPQVTNKLMREEGRTQLDRILSEYLAE